MESHEHSTRNEGKRASGLVMTGFGTLWWLAGAMVLPQDVNLGAAVAGVAIGVTLIAVVWRRLSAEGEQARFERNARAFTVVNIGQGVGIALVIVVANVLDAAAWIPALIAIVVGVHFLPLARLFAAPEYRWVAALLIATGLAGGLMAGAGSADDTVLRVVGLACAVVLWGSVVWTLWERRFVGLRQRDRHAQRDERPSP